MARNTIVPLSDLRRRAPEAGRIRLGIKVPTRNGKTVMKSIDTLRFTSPHRELIEQLAALHGGEARPWSDDRARIQNQFEVITPVSQIPVFLPANGLTQWYEMWSAGGCKRRCDGETVEVPERHGDEYVPTPYPCLCRAENKRQCRPYTRISVVLPELSFMGTWRLETKGWNAMEELPGMFELIAGLHESGRMVRALLGVEKRTDIIEGQKREFVVPTLTMEDSPLALAAGAADVKAIQASPTRAIGSGSAHRNEASEIGNGDVDEDEADEAELVDEAEMELRRKLAADAANFGLDPNLFTQAVFAAVDGDLDRIAGIHDDMIAGRVEPLAVTGGKVRWKQNN